MNEKQLVIKKEDPSPRIVGEGYTIVPVRIIAEELGAKVTWDAALRKVTIKKSDVLIELTIDSKTSKINGVNEKMAISPVIIEGSTMLPLSFVGAKLGVEFNWDSITSSVHMFKKDDLSSKPVVEPVDVVDDKNGKPQGEVLPTKPTNPSTPSTGTKPPVTGTTPPPGTGTGTGDKPLNPNTHLLTSIELSAKDLVVLAKDGVLKPTIMKLANPNRIVFDFPNTKLDDSFQKLLVNNAGEMSSKHPLVQKIRFSNYSDSPDTVRVILDLKSSADYKIQTTKPTNQWIATIGEHHLTVMIDAGHGDKDPGALSITGKHEKDFTLATAKKVSKLLSQDKRLEVLMTRSDNTFVELDDRVAFANDNQVDLFLSIHGNSAKANITGTETYYNRPESLSFANVVHKNVVAATGFADRKVREADFRVIKKTTMPAVLVEVGYLSNKDDEAAMYKDAFQDQVATSIVTAIKEYLDLK
ncbi:AMIN domain-containing protein [Paenibacillus sp. SYP-B3998]|uniref:AMIN domain-containing protein n=2 Tax=Paenibacillus sp. SYP-B3998 TaxID=2678564 RepID=A0A6G3ZVD9_9BACL|nr:AMIN domain-containing protein [Paenibacillus sp. SYP-B3998]